MSDSNKSTLRDLVNESNEIVTALIEAGGEITEELASRLSVIEVKMPEKIDSYAGLMDRIDMESAFFKMKAQEFQQVQRGLDNLKDKLKDALKTAMVELGQDSLKGVYERFKLSQLKPKLVVDQALLPKDFFTQVISDVPNKEKIEEAIFTGKTVPGASIVPVFSLRKYKNSKVD